MSVKYIYEAVRAKYTATECVETVKIWLRKKIKSITQKISSQFWKNRSWKTKKWILTGYNRVYHECISNVSSMYHQCINVYHECIRRFTNVSAMYHLRAFMHFFSTFQAYSHSIFSHKADYYLQDTHFVWQSTNLVKGQAPKTPFMITVNI